MNDPYPSPKPADKPRTLLERLTDLISPEPESRAELLEILQDAHARSLIDADSLSMIEGVFQVSDLCARDIMIPRAQMDALNIADAPSEFIPFVQEADQHRAALLQAKAANETANDTVARLEKELADHSEREAALDDRQSTLLESLACLREERSAMNSRRHVLEEMRDEREGLGLAVKKALENPDRFPGVHGLLGDLIETDRTHADLVESLRTTSREGGGLRR